jgi:hypothetical protein
MRSQLSPGLRYRPLTASGRTGDAGSTNGLSHSVYNASTSASRGKNKSTGTVESREQESRCPAYKGRNREVRLGLHQTNANMSDRTCRVTRQTSSTAFFAAASPKNPVRLARRFLCSTCHYGGRGTGAGHKHQRVHARVVKRWGGKWGLRRLTMHRRRSAFGQTLWKALRSTSLSSEKI